MYICIFDCGTLPDKNKSHSFFFFHLGVFIYFFKNLCGSLLGVYMYVVHELF